MKKLTRNTVFLILMMTIISYIFTAIPTHAVQPTSQANTGTFNGTAYSYQTIGYSLIFNNITTSVSIDDAAVKVNSQTSTAKYKEEFSVVELANRERRARGSIRIRTVSGATAYHNYDIVVTPPNFNSNNTVIGRSLVDNLYNESGVNKANLDKALANGGTAWINQIFSVRTQTGTHSKHTTLKPKRLWSQGSNNYEGTKSRVFSTDAILKFNWSSTTKSVLPSFFDNKFTFPKIDDDPPTHVSSSVSTTGTHHRESNSVLWVKPNTNVTVKIKQRDNGSGNKYQYLAIKRNSSSATAARSRHDFDESATNNVKQVQNDAQVAITSARRVLSNGNKDGEITWNVVPKENNVDYHLERHFNDKFANKSGYTRFHAIKTDNNAPTLEGVSVDGARYKDGNNYWFRPNDKATLNITQKDTRVGNHRQYLKINTGSDIRASHNFTSSATNINNVSSFGRSNNYLSIDSANRSGTGSEQTVAWGITLKKGSETYVPEYHFTDLLSNARGYDTGATGLGITFKTDGAAPTHISSSITGHRYKADNGDYWFRPGDVMSVTFRQQDTESGNERGYIRLHGNEQDVRYYHRFSEGVNDRIAVNSQFANTSSVEVQKATRTEHNKSTGYSTSKWDVKLNTSGHSYDVQYYHRDNVGNNLDYRTAAKARVDGVAPTVSITSDGGTLTATASDSLSGVKRIKTPNGTWVNGSVATYTVTSNGTYTFTVEDNVGNQRTQSITVSNVDIIPPTIQFVPYQRDWGISNITVAPLVFDYQSGIASSRYRVQTNGSWGPWTSMGSDNTVSIYISTHGESRVQVEATDKAGNTATSTSGYYRVDKNAPSISFSPYERDWENTDVRPYVEVIDTESQIKSIKYQIETNGTWGSWVDKGFSGTNIDLFSWNFTSNGTRRIRIEAEDNAGNKRTLTSGYYKIDKQNPTTTFSPNSREWSNTDATVSVKGNDSHSGVKRMRYRTERDGSWGNWREWGTGSSFPVTFSGNGSYRIEVEVEDNAGNSSKTLSDYHRVDKTNPTVSLSSTSRDWGTGNVTVTASASDSHSGVDAIRYRLETDGSWGEWTDWVSGSSRNITITANGSSRIQVQSRDKAGNMSSIVTSSYYRIDKTNPTVSLSPTSRDWGTGNVNVTASASDSHSGVDSIRYKIETNGTWGEWTDWTSSSSVSATLSAEGSSRIKVEAKDNVGNVSTITSGYYKIDITSPKVTFSPNARDWGTSNVVVSMKATDTKSGVNQMRYRIETDGSWGSWTSWSSSDTISTTLSSPGSLRLQVEAKDNVGNVSTTTSGYYRIDKAAPTVSFSPNSRPWNNTDVSVTITASDSQSGVDAIRYQIESNGSWGSWSTWTTGNTAKVSINSEGSYRIRVEAKDKVGNTSSTESGYYRVDKTAPKTTFSPNSRAWGTTNVNVSIKSTDAKSGVSQIRYRIETNGTWGSWQSWISGDSTTVTISNQGSSRIEVEAKDKVGNTSSTISSYYRVDKTAPSITLSPNSKSWGNKNVSVNISATDSKSGVDAIRYKVDTDDSSTSWSDWVTGNKVTVVIEKQGINRLEVQARDKVGNISTKVSGEYRIDKTNPTISFSPNGRDHHDEYKVRVNVADELSGVANVKYRLTESTSKPTSGWLTGSSSFDVNIHEMGTFYIHVEVTDIAGNTRYSRSNPLILHNEAPVLNKAWFTPNPAIIETDIRVNLEIQDKENNDVDVELSILHPTDSNGNRKEEYIRDYNLKYNSQSKKYQTMTYDFKPKVAGQYTMMVKLKDKYNHVLYSYSFTILDAGVVDSLVEHTDNWEKNRQRYNGLLPKEEQRDPGLFFAGEKFLLSTKTLNTTATEHLGDIGPPSNLMSILASNEHQLAQKVEVQLWEKRPNGQKAKIANMEGSDLVELELTTKTNVNGEKELIWVGEMWHESMMEWQEKDLIFEFIAYYDTHSPVPHIERKEVSKVVRSNVEYDIKVKGNDFFRLRKGK